jgi:hypothetical protein
MKDAIFYFNQDCVDAFCRLRDALISAPILPPEHTYQQKKKFLADIKYYFHGEPIGEKQVYSLTDPIGET